MPGLDVRVRAPGGDEPPGAVDLWSCVGCGAMGTSGDVCTGDCDDRAVVLIRAEDAAEAARWGGLVAEVAAAPPPGDAEWAWRAWQARARDLVRARAAPASEPVSAWWCAACGRIEAPQPCLGVCTRRHDAWVRVDAPTGATVPDPAVRRVVAQLAHATPRAGGWERSVAAVRDRARAALAGAPPELDDP